MLTNSQSVPWTQLSFNLLIYMLGKLCQAEQAKYYSRNCPKRPMQLYHIASSERKFPLKQMESVVSMMDEIIKLGSIFHGLYLISCFRFNLSYIQRPYKNFVVNSFEIFENNSNRYLEKFSSTFSYIYTAILKYGKLQLYWKQIARFL